MNELDAILAEIDSIVAKMDDITAALTRELENNDVY